MSDQRHETLDEMIADLCAKHDMTEAQVRKLIGIPNKRPRHHGPNDGWYEGDPRSKGIAVHRPNRRVIQ